MRCLSCNAALTDFEATRKYASKAVIVTGKQIGRAHV